MAKSIRNVMTSVRPEDQIEGLTEAEIQTQFMLAGYGWKKAAKHVKELKASAFIQTDGTKRGGEYVFWCVWWPWAIEKVDQDRMGAIVSDEERQGVLRRLDGQQNSQWYNPPETSEES